MRKEGKTFIIGSSILQRIKHRGLQRNVSVRTMTGAHISHVRDRIERTRLEHVSNIIVQAGGNDVSSKRNLNHIINDFIDIITDVNSRSPETRIFLAEITPRVGVDTMPVNAMLHRVCQEYNATLIRTTDSKPFVNTSQYWKDGLHLSDFGTKKLLQTYDRYTPILKARNQTGQTDTSHYCGESGHIARDCRHGDKIECYSCGHLGHNAKDCTILLGTRQCRQCRYNAIES